MILGNHLQAVMAELELPRCYCNFKWSGLLFSDNRMTVRSNSFDQFVGFLEIFDLDIVQALRGPETTEASTA